MSDKIKLDGYIPEAVTDKHWGFEMKMSPKLGSSQTEDIDLREFSSLPQDQRITSSCVAHAVVKALELKRIQKYGRDAHVDLSILAVYYLARELQFPKATNIDGGTYISLACDVLRRFGVPPETEWPFDMLKINQNPSFLAMRKAYLHKIEAFYRILGLGHTRIESILKALNNGHPVVFGTAVGDNWTNYRAGEVLSKPDNVIGRHATCLVGYEDGKFIGENSWGCYDEKTEILTNLGWVPFVDLKGSEQFATLNPDHELVYQSATHIHKYPFSGKMHKFKGRGVDLLVTPNHKMYLNNHHRAHTTDWYTCRADEIKTKRICFKKDAEWDQNKEVKYFDIQGHQIPADTWIQFMGYFISEGHTNFCTYDRHRERQRHYKTKKGLLKTYTSIEDYNEKYYTTGVCQKTGEVCDEIQQCLELLPFKFSHYEKNQMHNFTCASKKLYEELSPLGKAPSKYIPRYLLDSLSKKQCRILLEALIDGDGTRKGNWAAYYTVSKQLADDVQELALKCGYCGDISITDRVETDHLVNYLEYTVAIKYLRTTPELHYKKNIIPYESNVYCVTVPNGLIYVRRNGKATWCGNSNWGDGGFYLMDEDYIKWLETADIWVIQAPWEDGQ